MTYLIIPFSAAYIAALIGRNVKISKTFVYVIYALCGAAVLLVVISQFNHMYYDFDENNRYRVGELFWFSQALGAFYLLIVACFILRHRRSVNRGEIPYMLSYMGLPLMAMILQVFIWEQFEFLFIASTLAIVASFGGIQTQQAKLLKEKELELTEGRIAVMLSQIQPHFLYNALTAIARLCDKDNAAAKKAVIEFSKYLRGNMNSLTEGGLISFEQERAHIEVYLNLEKAIYGKALNVAYDIKASHFLLPALTVQPIVENAVKHGVGMREGGGTVTVAVRETDAAHLITVADDGVGFDAANPPPFVGIENVRRRLAEICGGALDIESEPGKGTAAVITIPKSVL